MYLFNILLASDNKESIKSFIIINTNENSGIDVGTLHLQFYLSIPIIFLFTLQSFSTVLFNYCEYYAIIFVFLFLWPLYLKLD